MWRVTLRGLAAAKLRFALTGLAVVLGTAFVAGALALGDTLEQGFDRLFTQIAGAADVQVTVAEDEPVSGTGRAASQAAAQGPSAGIPPAVLDAVRRVDEVAIASGQVEGSAVLIRDGEPVTEFGPPTLAFNAPAEPELTASELRTGRWPRASGEIAVDAGTAQSQGWKVGDEVQVVFRGPVQDAEIVGVFGVGELDNLAGASVVIVDRETAFAELDTDGQYTAVLADAAEGVSPAQVAEAVAAELGDDYEVRTAEEVAEEEQQALAQFTEVFSIGLLVFAGVSLLVGAFLIFNTFSIVLAQRLRELALLRAVGASRRQLLGSMLGEATIIGLLGGGLGAVLGVGVARLLRELLGTIGIDLPGSGVIVEPRTVVAAVAVGVVVTLIAAVAPARRAVRVPPVAALQEVAVGAVGGRRWIRVALAAVLLVGGTVSLLVGLLGGGGVAAVGGGAVAIILGVAGLSSLVAKPLTGAIGWPTARLRGVRGELARLNAMRNPRRTAATASALMIGLALVGFVAIFAESLRTSAAEAVERSFVAEVILQGSTTSGISDAAVAAAQMPEEVATVAPVTGEPLEIAGEQRFAAVMAAEELLAVLDFEVVSGDVADLRDGGVLVAESAARQAGVTAGDDLAVETADGLRQLPVVAVVEANALEISWIVARRSYGAEPTVPAFSAYVALADGVSAQQGQDAVSAALADFPQVRVLDQAEVVEEVSSRVDQLVGVFVALLALSVLIALLGIVNTLALSVVERVREIGLLRAVGMVRPQVRAMVRSEASIVSLLGAALGLVLGLVFGVVFVSAAEDLGATTLAIPWGQLAIGLVLAALAGLLAGVLPARRAARLDVLQALRNE
jgi:putative ABC transport system permease protein